MDIQSPTHLITNSLPADEICERFGVKERTIRQARERGVFPASWYIGMKELCEKHGLDCPDEAFNWKSPSSTTSAGAS